MSKTRLIAVREYLSAVRTKGFIVGVILMPFLMGGGLLLQHLTRGIVDLEVRKAAVIDRTADSKLFTLLESASTRRNQSKTLDPDTRQQIKPEFQFQLATLTEDLNKLRLELSDKVRRGDLFAFIEIGPDVLAPKSHIPTTVPTAGDAYSMIEAVNDPDSLVYYTSNRPTYAELREFVQQTLQPRIVGARLGQSQTSIETITKLSGTLVVPRGLAEKDPSGNLTFEPRKNEILLIVLPIVLIMLMLVVVLVGASPLTTNIIEEKQLRIGEVLLGSVTPFQLMFGKLLGGVATSLTLGVIYITGAIVVASRLGVLHLVTPSLIVWFLVFTVVASLMYGSLFVVAGAAASNIKEAQALVTPVMLIVVMPMFLIGPMMNEPHGLIARIGTFFPLSAPLVTMFRLAVPPALPWWQPLVAICGSGLMMLVLIWLAGRVFRAGFLLVGRPASLKELVGWILRG
ncbi:MAG: ABC transporter permease [Burkholderiales bacterium]|nr:ABC transporter permease [Phycisphaerae bacterium]